MIFSPQIWMLWARRLMPAARADWLAAMQAELGQMRSPAERQAFAFGCFKSALLEAACSRKGLSFIARIGGGSLFFIMCCAAGFFWNARGGSQPELASMAKIVSALCFAYMCAAALLMTTLRGLKIYAAAGAGLAGLSWIYCLAFRPSAEHLSAEFLTAISFEAAGIMAGLYMAAVYLGWLYSPAYHDV